MPSDTRLARILRHLILKSFPTLRTRPIAIHWGAVDELFYYTEESGHCSIFVNECFSEASRSVLEGGVVHELCHIDADLHLGAYARELAWERYNASRWYRMREERRVERRAVELGYAPALLALIRYSRRLGYSFRREHGLLYAEILHPERL
jgi:hypothetical protein